SPSGVVIHGRGCSECLRGQRCSFLVSIRAPAHWIAPEQTDKGSKHTWWQRDLSLLLRGPALAHGDVRCLDPPGCLELSVSYRVWDIGEYCSAAAGWLVAERSLSAPPRPSARPRGRAVPRPSSLLGLIRFLPRVGHWGVLPHTQSPLFHPFCPPLVLPSSSFHPPSLSSWAFFPCSPKELPPSQWISALDRRGIREISIVGDSHQRFLAAHLFFLLTGEDMTEMEKGRTPPTLSQAHWTVPNHFTHR
ncbi:unnamed protein product, partial [Closterium sp. Naga37s-1]